ncbi:hypothetical protein TSAR_002463 [Trichomalopsis sarcophagae]|uniref:Peptidase S1 domain-containing protein n=1 Tax=Trichomalopsis sarcophagae TaxID=543379 RepID=A0A232FJF9_9HYME|nr:hypothetical protein TSAR_002463 [Trichomalopsis sarcophagae]
MQIQSYLLSALLISIFVSGIDSESARKRIYGGSVAGIGEFPYMVSLRRDSVHDCGGALISAKHVLTAYHCISDGYDNLTAVVGTNSLKTGGTAYRIEKVLIYPPFDGDVVKDAYDHDIAVLTLEQEVKLSHRVSSVPLASSALKSGASVHFTGWGDDYSQRNTKFMQKLKVTAMNNLDCEAHYQKYGYGFLVKKNQSICTFRDVGYGACFGDSGAPLIYEGEIVGVLSIGFDMCAIGIPDLFESVFYYLDFIRYAMTH